jgi:hypothetical protein
MALANEFRKVSRAHPLGQRRSCQIVLLGLFRFREKSFIGATRHERFSRPPRRGRI